MPDFKCVVATILAVNLNVVPNVAPCPQGLFHFTVTVNYKTDNGGGDLVIKLFEDIMWPFPNKLVWMSPVIRLPANMQGANHVQAVTGECIQPPNGCVIGFPPSPPPPNIAKATNDNPTEIFANADAQFGNDMDSNNVEIECTHKFKVQEQERSY